MLIELGINLSFATLLLSKNCSVLFADLVLRPEAETLVAEYAAPRTATRPQAIFQTTDVTSWAELAALFATAARHLGGADIVCPGAGVYEPPSSSFWRPPGDADSAAQSRYKALDINLSHPLRATQLAIAHFLERARAEGAGARAHGCVVHISSIAAQACPLPVPLYNTSKAGLSHFVRTMAPLEARLGIRVTGVAPGVIKTPLWTEHPEKLRMLDPEADEWVTPEEVAATMLGLVERPENVGGTILEIGKDRVRRVERLGDPGPSGAGHTVGKMSIGEDEIWELLGGEGWGLDK